MTTEEKKTIEMIRQIRKAVEDHSLSLEQFPLEDLANLIKVTIGREFIGMTGGMEEKHFQPLIDDFLKMMQHCVEQKDVSGCVKTLILLEEQYVCFDAILTAYKGQMYVEQYKLITNATGEAYSRLQYDLHQAKRSQQTTGMNFGESGKGVVYTCTFYSKQGVQQPEYINVDWDYICFTNDKSKWGTKEGAWEYRKLELENLTDTKALLHACMLKPYLVLPEYDYSIWVNPCYKIIGDLELLQASYGKCTSFLAFPSYVIDDVYEVMITGLGSDDENINMRKKSLQYEKEGYPRHFGMISDNIIFRNHRDEKMREVMETWWQEAMNCERLWSFGFTYAAWKHDFDYAICDLFIETNPYFKNVEFDLEVKKNE